MSLTLSPSGHEMAKWQRFSVSERLSRTGLYLALVAVIAWALTSIEVIPEFLIDAPAQFADMFTRMWPIDVDAFVPIVLPALIETLHIAALATLLGLLMGVPVGFLAASNVTPLAWLNALARFVMVSTRSISTLLWALFFVAMFGPTAFAGMLAIAFHSIGFIAKMMSEALLEVPKGPIEALSAAGSSRSQQVVMGFWPAIKPSFWAVALFRWDINVRESAVLGLVGAGGIGMALDTAMNLFQWDRVALILCTIFFVVLVIEAIVSSIRLKIL